MGDSPNVIRQKIKTAVTDSGREIKYDPKKKPAVSNLILIYASLSGKSTKAVEREYENKGYAEFKGGLAETVIKSLESFQRRKKEFARDIPKIKKILSVGQKVAEHITGKKLEEVKKKIGISI